MLSNMDMEVLSMMIRAISKDMDHSLRELDLPSTWTGADADRFRLDWHDLVTARLHAAANKLDGVSFTEVVDALNG